MQGKRGFDFGFALIGCLVALLVVWVAAEAISAVTVGHDISEAGCIWVIVVSLVIATLLGRWGGKESAQEKAQEERKTAARMEAEKAAKRERDAVAAVMRKAELLGRDKLDWSEEKLLAQEEAKQRARCPKCRMEIDSDASICPYCRTSFEDSYRCGRCKMTIDQYATICPYCHADFRPWWDRD